MASPVGLIAGYVSAAAGCALAATAGYLWLLAIASRLRRRPPPAAGDTKHRFLIVIPAHNEETVLAECLAHVRDLDYPGDRRREVVIADNCTDRTADVARGCGVDVVTRFDPERVGKGYALAHALHLLDGWADAVVVLDADTRPARGLLRAFDARLAAEQEMIQARCALAPVGAQPLTYLLSVESRLENDWFYAGKEQLGSPAMLRGNGMCLSREALRRVPWEARGLAEDAEYTVAALRAGVSPHFAAETSVVSDAPATGRQVTTQRRRWTAGHWRVALRESPRLIAAGIARRDWGLIDFGLGLLVTSKSALLAAALAAAAVAWWLAPAGTPRAVALVSAAAAAIGLAGYGVLGIAASRPTWRQAISLAWLLPLCALRAAAGVAAVIGIGRNWWQKTPRGRAAKGVRS